MTTVGADWHAIVFDSLADAAGVEVDLLAPDTTLRELGLSSMQLMELLYLLEEELGIVLAPELLEGVETIADIVDCAERELAEVA